MSASSTGDNVTENPSKSYLLDTSALMALIEDEPGADRVEALLRSEGVLVPFLGALEVYYVTLQERSQDEADRRLALIRQLPATWLDRVTLRRGTESPSPTR